MARYNLFSLFVLALVACDGGDDGVSGGSTHPATVRGNAGRAGPDPSGAEITAFHVNADGSTEADANGSTTADADGNYSLDVGVLGEGENNLIIEAVYSDGSRASLLLTGTLSEGDTRPAPPMDEESSTEADVFLHLVATGQLSADSDEAALIRAFIEASVAASYAQADAAEREVVAEGLASATAAWMDTTSSSGDGEAALDAYISLLIEADAEADSAAESGGDATVDALVALRGAWTEAGYTTEDMAYCAGAAAEAQLHVFADASGSAVAASWSELSDLRASLMAEVVAGAWTEVGSSDEEAPDEASGELVASLEAILGVTCSDADAAWDEAMDEYGGSILDEISGSLDVDGSVALAEAVSIAVVAQAELTAEVESAGRDHAYEAGEAIAESMNRYRSTIRTEVTGSLVASGSFDETEASALATIVGQVYANAE